MMHLRLERRSTTPAWFSLALPLAALAATLILCSGLVALAGANVFDAYAQLFLTPFSTGFDLEQTAIKAAPLVLTGLAVAVAFRARFWNIGGEGQLYAGAMAAAFFGAQLWLPAPLLWPAMILSGARPGRPGPCWRPSCGPASRSTTWSRPCCSTSSCSTACRRCSTGPGRIRAAPIRPRRRSASRPSFPYSPAPNSFISAWCWRCSPFPSSGSS